MPRDDAEGVKWTRLAAEQGYLHAQTRLGSMYEDGSRLPKDYAEAEKWYCLAVDQGHAGAVVRLFSDVLLRSGEQKDFAKAMKWARVAGRPGDEFWVLPPRFDVPHRRPRPAQDLAQAVKWYRLAANRVSHLLITN